MDGYDKITGPLKNFDEVTLALRFTFMRKIQESYITSQDLQKAFWSRNLYPTEN